MGSIKVAITQGCHWSGNGHGKIEFFKVREKSGNFILSQGKLKLFHRRCNSIEGWKKLIQVNVISAMFFLLEMEAGSCNYIWHFAMFGQGNLIFNREKSGNFENWCLWQPCYCTLPTWWIIFCVRSAVIFDLFYFSVFELDFNAVKPYHTEAWRFLSRSHLAPVNTHLIELITCFHPCPLIGYI